MGFQAKLNPSLREIMDRPYAFEVIEGNKRKAAEKWGAGLIDFGVGDPVDATPGAVRDVCKTAVDKRSKSGYPVTIGSSEFREAVAKWYSGRFSVKVSSDEVLGNFGAKQTIFLMPYHFLTPGKGEYVIMPNPAYPPYFEGTMMAGGKSYMLNLLEENNFEPNLDGIPKEVSGNAALMYVNSPHNPTGKVYSKEKLKETVDFCLDNNIVLVGDECYSENAYSEKPPSIFEIRGAEECSIAVNSLSKRSMMTGYRVGFTIIRNPGLMKPYKIFEQKSHSGVSTFIQDAAIAALSGQGHVEEMNSEYEKRIEAILPALDAAGLDAKKPQGTFYLWSKIRSGQDPVEFCSKLLMEKGINATPGNLISNDFDGVNPGKGYVRFAMVPALEQTKEAAKRLRE